MSVWERFVFLLLRAARTRTRLHLSVWARVIRGFSPQHQHMGVTALGRHTQPAKLDRDRLSPQGSAPVTVTHTGRHMFPTRPRGKTMSASVLGSVAG